MDVPYLLHVPDGDELWLVDGEQRLLITPRIYDLLASNGADLPSAYGIEELREQNAKLRELVARMAEALGIDCELADPNWCKSPCVLEFGCWPIEGHAEIRCPAWAAMQELGIEVSE